LIRAFFASMDEDLPAVLDSRSRRSERVGGWLLVGYGLFLAVAAYWTLFR
jgi:hypothetical protein